MNDGMVKLLDQWKSKQSTRI